MALTANFANTPHNESAVVTGALTNLNTDAPGGIVALFTAPAGGTNITRITAQPRATTTTATAAYLFIQKAATPTIQRVKDTVTVPAQTIAATGAVVKTTFADYSETTPLRLGAGETLYCGIANAQASGIVFNVETADF